MKKAIAFFLALVMLFACAACGGTAGNDDQPAAGETGDAVKTDNTENTDAHDDAAEPVTLSVKSLEFVVAEADAEPEGFLVVVDRGDAYHWQIGIDSYEKLYKTFDLTLDQSTYVNVFVALENEEKYPYLYPEEGTWTAYVTADTVSGWFNEEFQDGVVAAFNEWIQEVYSRFDYQTIREATIDQYVEASPAEDYVVTEEDMALFKAYVAAAEGGYSFLTPGEQSGMYTVVYNGIARELGESVAYDTYQYLTAKIADKMRNKADVGTLLRKMGVTNDGGVQESYGCAAIASYFDVNWWPDFVDNFAVFKQLLAKGVTISTASDNMWRLHAIDGGRILAEISFNDAGANNAFAIVAGKDGTLYWKVGIDYCDALREEFGLTGDDYVDLQVMPVIDEEKAEHALPDGLNPDVTRYFAYFEDDAVTWTLQTRGGVEFPDWFTSDMENAVMAAFEEWKTEVYSHIDLDAAFAAYPGGVAETYTDEDVALLKEYVTLLREYQSQGISVDSAIKETLREVCGRTVISEMEAWMKAKWRTVHTDCPGACIKIGYCDYYGLVSFDGPTDIIEETTTALMGVYFDDIKWSFNEDPEAYPFACIAELYDHNLVPYSDGTKWYFATGENCDVIFEIEEADLLAD